jgi:phosphatidylserine/phosphatidylglycerophosphate/cardiolipin synthase-like enzyme
VKFGDKVSSFVTMQTSHNFHFSQSFNFNDMLVFSERKDIFAAYKSYWQALHDQVKILDYMGTSQGVFHFDDIYKTAIYFSPSLSIDPYVEELKDFTCGSGEILLTQSFFSENRGRTVLKMLEDIKAKNPDCKISALIRADDGHNDMKTEIKNSTVKFKQINRIKSLGVSIHAKTMLLKNANGNKRVVTGSMNMTDHSLQGDETVLGISDDKVFDAYASFWEFVDHHTRK